VLWVILFKMLRSKIKQLMPACKYKHKDVKLILNKSEQLSMSRMDTRDFHIEI